MKFYYKVRTIEGQFTVYKATLLSDAEEFIEKQDEPMMYEIVEIKTGKVIE